VAEDTSALVALEDWPGASPEVAGVLVTLNNVSSGGLDGEGQPVWTASCPVPTHGKGDGDRNASFSVSAGKSQPVVAECFAGCEWSDVRAALEDHGVSAEVFTGSGTPAQKSRTTRRLRAIGNRDAAMSPIPEQGDPDEWCDRLFLGAELPHHGAAALVLRFLTEERGLSADTLQHNRIGWDGERVTIPVRDMKGVWVNVRRYLPHASNGEPKIMSTKGHGSGAPLYPVEVLHGNDLTVLVCEGEIDALLANQHADGRWVAVSGTGGAGNVPRDLTPLRGRDVRIAYDSDKPGREGAAKLSARLRGIARTVTVVDLTRCGLAPDSGEDISDLLAGDDGTGAAALATELGADRPVTERFRLFSAADLAEPVPPMRWLVHGVWPEGSYGVLGGAKKTLKTYTGLALALSVASGERFLGHFEVPAVGSVLYLLGEGGQKPTQRRLQAVAAAMDLDLRDLDGRLAVTFDVAPANGQEFLDAIRRGLDAVQPDLVVLDPLYAFHPPGVEAQNLYDRGQMLAELRGLVGEAAFVVADHFRKTGGQGLDLDSIAQAGMAQWADSWVLQTHAADPDLSAGEFRIATEFGSRQWGGSRYEIGWSLGQHDADAGVHIGQIAWSVETLAVKLGVTGADRSVDLQEQVLARVREHPGELTTTDIVKGKDVTGAESRKRAAVEALVETGRIRSSKVKKLDAKGRSQDREVWTIGDGASASGRARTEPPPSERGSARARTRSHGGA